LPPLWFHHTKYFPRGSFYPLVAAPPPPPNEDLGLHFIWPLPFQESGISGSTRSLHSSQHMSLGHWVTQTSPQQGSIPQGRTPNIQSENFMLHKYLKFTDLTGTETIVLCLAAVTLFPNNILTTVTLACVAVTLTSATGTAVTRCKPWCN
jgi:hypothetical protein